MSEPAGPREQGGRWLAPVFGVLAKVRGARAFHARGAARSGWWQGEVGHGVPSLTGPHPALARVSRGIGLPPPLPDVLGVALRVSTTDHGDVDLLFATYRGRRWPVAWPQRDHGAREHSSISSFRSRSGLVRFLASLDGDVITVRQVDASGNERPVGSLVMEHAVPAELSEALRFDPTRCGPDLEPTGFYNWWRKPAYQASQLARAPHAGSATDHAHLEHLQELFPPRADPGVAGQQ